MLQEVTILPGTTDLSSMKGVLPVADLFSPQIIKQIERFKSGEIDNLIIRGCSVPSDLPATPREIRDVYDTSYPAYVLRSLGEYLGEVSPKGVENTIRFRTGNLGIVNEETWHGHYQYQYTLFYCLRGDPAAQTYFLSANSLIKEATGDMAKLLLAPFSYVAGEEAFSLIEKKAHGYSISHRIYDRSDFERYVKDLDLPDVIKALEKIASRTSDPEAERAVWYLLEYFKKTKPSISYKPGDVALYDERSTIRFSPSYTPTTFPANDRWILALTVESRS